MEHIVNIVPENVKIGDNIFLCTDCNNEIRLVFDGKYFSSPNTHDVIRLEYTSDPAFLPYFDVTGLYKPPVEHVEDEPEYKLEYQEEAKHVKLYEYVIAVTAGVVLSSIITILIQHIRW